MINNKRRLPLQVFPALLVWAALMAGCGPADSRLNGVQAPATAEAVTTDMLTPTPEPATEAVPASPTSPQTPAITVEPGAADLTAFVEAWNSSDLQAIRSLYAPEARIYSEAAMTALQERQPVEAQVSGEALARIVDQHAGYTLQTVGELVPVADKLGAFLYRWEREGSVINGAALLRYEGGKILLHAFLEEAQSAAAAPGGSPALTETLEGLMEVWNSGDLQAARRFYSPQAVILSDEDLALAPWRDSPQPAGLEQLLKQFAGWEPTIVGEPIQFGPFVLSYWRWSRFDKPIGSGIRLLRLQDGAIQSDVRFAIRPWEARGAGFLEQ